MSVGDGCTGAKMTGRILLRSHDEAHHVATSNIGSNHAHTAAVLAVYFDGTVDPVNAGHLRERHVLPGRKRQGQIGQHGRRFAGLLTSTQQYWRTSVPSSRAVPMVRP